MSSHAIATLETRRGPIEVELYEVHAPKTVANFLKLAGEGFYTDRVWHRVVENAVVQTGCPNGDGSGDAGYTIADEPNALKHLTGTLSMANTGEPNTGGSQFFICVRPLP
ncbi:MAG: peptidyl-prolyl cis-trans isomerase B (cyclophilin B), partial [Myxococcota bacterium]